MARPRRFLVRMAAFLFAALVLVAVWYAPIRTAFVANVPLNSLILGVFALGILFNVRQVLMIYPELAWLEGYRSDKSPLSDAAPPRLLAPLAAMLRERSGRLVLSALAMRSVLDGISARLDESRDISRYLIGLLVFLGLLGTFWGLLETMSSIRDVIGGLSVGGGDPVAMFGALKKGLEAPLSGMGTAFSSSLFGLAASLVLGFLDLQSGQAQNQFFNELEEWLSGQTRLSGSLLSAEGADQSVPAYVQALLEQTAESLDNLQRAIGRGEENRTASAAALATLGTQLSTLVDHMRTEQSLMRALAESHMEMKQILAKMADARSAGAGGLDEATRGHIRNLDIQLARLADEARSGRDHLVDQMRAEIKLLARTIAAAAETGGR